MRFLVEVVYQSIPAMGEWRCYSKEVEAENEEEAKAKAFPKLLGYNKDYKVTLIEE